MHNHFTIGDTSSWGARLLENAVTLLLIFGCAVAAYRWFCVDAAPDDPEGVQTDSPEEQDPPEDGSPPPESGPSQDSWTRVWDTGLFLVSLGGLLYDKGSIVARVAQGICKAGKML